MPHRWRFGYILTRFVYVAMLSYRANADGRPSAWLGKPHGAHRSCVRGICGYVVQVTGSPAIVWHSTNSSHPTHIAALWCQSITRHVAGQGLSGLCWPGRGCGVGFGCKEVLGRSGEFPRKHASQMQLVTRVTMEGSKQHCLPTGRCARRQGTHGQVLKGEERAAAVPHSEIRGKTSITAQATGIAWEAHWRQVMLQGIEFALDSSRALRRLIVRQAGADHMQLVSPGTS